VILKGTVAGSLSGDPVFGLGFYEKCERESEPFTLMQKPCLRLHDAFGSARVNSFLHLRLKLKFIPAP